MLSVKEISTFYGKIQALWGVSFDVREREIVALVGANGAGKTTLLNTISGIVRPASGSIEFCDRPIEREAAATIVEQGITQVPQGGKLFPDMTVKENLEMGAYQANAWHHRKETFDQVYVHRHSFVASSSHSSTYLQVRLRRLLVVASLCLRMQIGMREPKA